MICGKIIYASQDEAVKTIYGINRDKKRRANSQPKKAYYCQSCKGWHVHSKRKRNRTTQTKSLNIEAKSKRNDANKTLRIIDYNK